jgi:hypothetical protein
MLSFVRWSHTDFNVALYENFICIFFATAGQCELFFAKVYTVLCPWISFLRTSLAWYMELT